MLLNPRYNVIRQHGIKLGVLLKKRLHVLDPCFNVFMRMIHTSTLDLFGGIPFKHAQYYTQ